jgi:hypothetical protein
VNELSGEHIPLLEQGSNIPGSRLASRKTLIGGFPEHDDRHLTETAAFPEMTIVISRKPLLSRK